MTTKEIREKDDSALKHELVEKQKHLFDLRSQAVTEKLEDPTQLGKTRREIARIKTIIRHRELDAKKSEAKPAKVAAAAK
jgi:large subunit ribosomal protein L29